MYSIQRPFTISASNIFLIYLTMKYIKVLKCEPLSIAKYRKGHEDITSQNAEQKFKSFKRSEASRTFRDELKEAQGHVCAYCESRVQERDQSLEHVAPKSVYPERTFDFRNLVVTCLGGETDGNHKGAARLSCGAKKRDKELPACADPRNLPDKMSLFWVDGNGALHADPSRCAAHDWDIHELELAATEVLGLNCERLKLARSGEIKNIIKKNEQLTFLSSEERKAEVNALLRQHRPNEDEDYVLPPYRTVWEDTLEKWERMYL